MKAKNLIGKITIIAIILMVLLVSVILVIKNKTNSIDTNQYDNKVLNETIHQSNKELKQVKSATAFFTVQSCVNKYITYISQGDLDSVYKILDNQYIQEYDITQANVLDKIGNVSNQSIFEATEMYVEEIDEDNNKYYVTGVLKKEATVDNIVLNDNFKIIVILNYEDMIFSVIPLEDGGVF